MPVRVKALGLITRGGGTDMALGLAAIFTSLAGVSLARAAVTCSTRMLLAGLPDAAIAVGCFTLGVVP